MASSLKDTGSLKNYIANTQPILAGGEKLFLGGELKKIQDAISGLVKAAQALEARLNVGGL